MPRDFVWLDGLGGRTLHYSHHHDPLHVKWSPSWEEDPSSESITLPAIQRSLPSRVQYGNAEVIVDGGDKTLQNQHRIIMKPPPSMMSNVFSLLWDRTPLNHLILFHWHLKISSSTSCNHLVHSLPLCLCHSHPYSISHTMTNGHMQRGSSSYVCHGNFASNIPWSWPRDERASKKASMVY